MSFARKLRRRAAPRDVPAPLLRVVSTAGVTLGLTAEQVQAGLAAMRGEQPHTETSDTLLARSLALCVLSGHVPTDVEALQAQLEARNGPGFVRRVAAMGTPTASLPDATFAKVRRILAAMAFVLMLLAPSLAEAAQRTASAEPPERIRYRRVNFGRRRRNGYSNPRGWTRSSKNYGISRRLSRSHWNFGVGSEPEHEKNYYAGSRSKLSWFGGGGASTSGSCPKRIRSSPSKAATGVSSGLLGLSLGVCLLGCGSVDSASADLGQLDDEARELFQGCAWHAGDADFTPRDENSCWRVHTGAATRLTLEPLRDVCDAPQLPRCVLLAGTDKPTGYFDRDEIDAPRIIRYERSPNCEPCE